MSMASCYCSCYRRFLSYLNVVQLLLYNYTNFTVNHCTIMVVLNEAEEISKHQKTSGESRSRQWVSGEGSMSDNG